MGRSPISATSGTSTSRADVGSAKSSSGRSWRSRASFPALPRVRSGSRSAIHRAGKLGGVAAWLGFTLPSALALTVLAIWAREPTSRTRAGCGASSSLPPPSSRRGDRHGKDARSWAAAPRDRGGCRGRRAPRPGLAGQVATILAAGAIGALVFRALRAPLPLTMRFPIGRRTAVACGGCVRRSPRRPAHGRRPRFVPRRRPHGSVLPCRRARLRRRPRRAAAPGRRGRRHGLGLAAGVSRRVRRHPGCAGAALHVLGVPRRDSEPSPNGVAGAAIALVAIFVPSFLLLGAALPLWSAVRERVVVQAAVAGIGAAVVGLLAAALWDPVLRTSVHGVGEVALRGVALRLAPGCPDVGSGRRSCDRRRRAPLAHALRTHVT